MTELAIHETEIPGLLVLDLVVHGDARGWFKENWQREKMLALGLPDFAPVQNNMSANLAVGVTRGIHAEPWDKLVSVAHGRVFGAWVDLRAGASFGRVVTAELGPDKAVFVPRGVGNAYQTLAPDTVYSYLVNEHWSPQARDQYTYLNLADPTVAIAWPTAVQEAVVSDADRAHPMLGDVTPMSPLKTVIIGSGGQLGRALQPLFPDAVLLDRPDFDLAEPETFDWSGVGTIINAAAYTAVDQAEQDRAEAWRANVTGVARLVGIARRHRVRLVHVSSDYVFDGTHDEHSEDEPFSPLGFYGVTKAAADELVATWERHYLVRTSWVVGEGKNFVATMQQLAAKGVAPAVVDDQFGRLTHTDNLAAGIAHLLGSGAAYGTYNLTDDGPVRTWYDIARQAYADAGADPAKVSPTSTEAYAEGKQYAARPRHSTLDLDKIIASGYRPRSY